MSKNIPNITQSTKFNFLTSIWIVPIIALFIAGWLAFQYFDNRGPEIKIIFPKNEGLVAGQSVVKFKNVPVGKVTKIYLNQKDDNVVVIVRMYSKQAENYMTQKTKFWIVKPEVGLGGISGLDTLISGTYIDVYSEKGGTFKDEFYGLSQPYHDSSKGEYFQLNSQDGRNVSVGTPVYYKSIAVGKVEHTYLSLDHKSIDVIIFIEKEYASFVHENSRFWVKNMINIDFTKGELDIDIAPLQFMLSGGILFSSSGNDIVDKVPEKYIFPLFKSKTEAENKNINTSKKKNKKFTLLADESLASLSVDALVRFDGFDIGKVLDIEIYYDKFTHNMLGEVLLVIDTSVFYDRHDANASGLDNFYTAVKDGLRAKISTLDPITGALFVDLTFDHKDGVGKMTDMNKYPRIPMTSNHSASIMDSVSQILTKLNNLPLDKLLDSVTKVVESTAAPIANANDVLIDLKTTLKHINALTGKKSFEVLPDELSKVLKEITKTLKTTQQVVKGYDSNSLVKQQLSQTLKVLTETSLQMNNFLKMLNRKPNSLIFGDN